MRVGLVEAGGAESRRFGHRRQITALAAFERLDCHGPWSALDRVVLFSSEIDTKSQIKPE